LHLVHPLGFDVDHARLRRAGLDYREFADVAHHDDFTALLDALGETRIVAFSQHAQRRYTDFEFAPGDALLFGPESTGLPQAILDHDRVDERLRIPIAPGGRSLNLANAAAIAVYEAWRQHDFAFER
jgi:tRNA (cytidine/uridine-2'-O-)-methyltransferase